MNASNNGDMILVAAGTYNENVVVDKSVSLIGAGAEVTIVNAYNTSEHVFNVTVNSVNISGFTVTGTAADLKAGIYLTRVDYANISNNKALSISYCGIYLEFSSSNTLINNTANSNLIDGIYLASFSNNNILINNTTNSNGQGIVLYPFSNSNTLTNNTINSNINLGLELDNSSNNAIYNNIFNNDNNAYFGGTNVDVNTWNTTRQSGTNIIGGSYLGGNFWAYPNGTGYSQTCADADRDGICNSAYVLDGNNTDYLPISTNFTFYYNLTGRITNASYGLGIPGALVKLNAYPQYNTTTCS